MMALLSNTLFEYFDNHKSEDGGRIPSTINIGMPFSLRQPSKNLQDVKLVNDFITIPVTIPIKKELDEVLPKIKKQFSALKVSMDPFGFLYSFTLLVMLPFTLSKYAVNFISDKYHLLFTNLNASKVPYLWANKKQLGQFYYCTGIGHLNLGIAVCTTGPFMSMSCYADEKQIKNP